jgi:hypothetical protein
MKIDKTRLHPLYDQYSNDENRLTHALLHTIGSSNWILTRFLKNIVAIKELSLSGTFEISTQKIPLSHGDKDPIQVESVPDAWIIDEKSSLGIAIEVKDLKNKLGLVQLRSHIKRIKGYDNPHLLAITPDLQKPDKITELQQKKSKNLNVVWQSWGGIYKWLTSLQTKKLSKNTKEEFLVSSMLQFLERRRNVLGFQGIYFTNIFNVSEAKDILNSEMELIEPTVRKLYRDLTRRRPAITTISQESVWDCFGVEKGFTKDVHISFSIRENFHQISLIIPNSAKEPWKRLKIIFSDKKLENKLMLILQRLRKRVPHLYVQFHHRHFRAQRYGVTDGLLEFNIDTLGKPFKKQKSTVKEFPLWFDAIKSAIEKKKKINGQIMFGVRFYFNETKAIEKPSFINSVKSTLTNLKPLYDFLKKTG